MNQPYVKKYDANDVCTNPITAANPYLHRAPNRAARRGKFKYIMSYHPITGDFMGKTKTHGNNRKPNRKGKRTPKF